MIVFKTFLKILNQCKGIVLLYTGILIAFSIFNMSNQDSGMNFQAEKPDVFIQSEDETGEIAKNLVNYFQKHTNVKDLSLDLLQDALFYRDVNMIIKIPENYSQDVLNGKYPKIEIQSTGDYQASLANMLLEKYLQVQFLYQPIFSDTTEYMQKMNDTLDNEVQIELLSTRDVASLTQAKSYFNFANYAILAGLVYIVCLILSIFRNEPIRKRTIISSMNYKTYNRSLFWANSLFAIFLWGIYVLVGFIIVGKAMFSGYGLFFSFNSLLFTICSLALAFFLGNLISNKDAISGIVNVIALGSSFLCGAFVPVEFLPKSVLGIAHILPSYWYINTNEQIYLLENFHWNSILPVFLNFGVLILFTIIFTFLTNWISKRKLSID